MVVGAITRLYSPGQLLKNWIVVYAGNLIGAVLSAYLVYQSGIFGHGDTLTSMGQMAVKVADYKNALPFGEAFLRGVLCNMLVILGIIMSYFSRDVISKIVCVILPIMTFVASGFEHCVANMYLVPAGLFRTGGHVSQHPARHTWQHRGGAVYHAYSPESAPADCRSFGRQEKTFGMNTR